MSSSSRNNALAIGAASFASTSKDIADSAGRQATPKGICAPSPMEIELEKMYKGPYKSPMDKYFDTMLKR